MLVFQGILICLIWTLDKVVAFILVEGVKLPLEFGASISSNDKVWSMRVLEMKFKD